MTSDPLDSLTHGARRIAERAVEQQAKRQHDRLGVHHWLLALLERHGAMAESLVPGLEAAQARRDLRRALDGGDVGDALTVESAVARSVAASDGKTQANERELAVVILAAAGYAARDEPDYEPPDVAIYETGRGKSPGAPRATAPTPTLDEFGIDLTRRARAGELPPVVGREKEIRQVCTTLCRRTKRNPALIGPAGTGKTAIVEGLAKRVVAGEVPEVLQGIRIVALQPSSLVAGARMVEKLEERVKAVIHEAEQDGIVLFIDEMHSIVGSGGLIGATDIAAQLKPALARGLSCIGATTDDEYRTFIQRDRALERRFRPIAVGEMSLEDSFVVLKAHRDHLREIRGVEVPDDVLHWLMDFSEDFLRNRYFPDKVIDLLEQCVATAVVESRFHVDVAGARAVAQEMVGMPIELDERIVDLGRRIREASLLTDEATDELLDRLSVTMRGLDLRPARPNAVVLLAGPATDCSEELAETIADALFADAHRVVELDFGQYDRPEDVNTLLGAPPAYIGFGEHLPLHDLARMPWSVVVCKNVDGCHPQVRDVLTQALAEGFITERSGRRVYLSDAVMLLTAPSVTGEELSVGGYL